MHKKIIQPSSLLETLVEHLFAAERYFLEVEQPSLFERGNFSSANGDEANDVAIDRGNGPSLTAAAMLKPRKNGDSLFAEVENPPESCDVIVVMDELAKSKSVERSIQCLLAHCRQLCILFAPRAGYSPTPSPGPQLSKSSFPETIGEFGLIQLQEINDDEPENSKVGFLAVYGSNAYLARRKLLEKLAEFPELRTKPAVREAATTTMTEALAVLAASENRIRTIHEKYAIAAKAEALDLENRLAVMKKILAVDESEIHQLNRQLEEQRATTEEQRARQAALNVEIQSLLAESHALKMQLADFYSEISARNSASLIEPNNARADSDDYRTSISGGEKNARKPKLFRESSITTAIGDGEDYRRPYRLMLAQTFWRLRFSLLPIGSWREAIARRMWRAFKRDTAGPRKWLQELAHRIGRRHRRISEADRANEASAGERSAAANLDTVNLLTMTFFNLEGKDMFCGGAERYLIELNRLIRSLGYQAKVFQAGSGEWTHWYNDLRVESIPIGEDYQRLNGEYHRRVSAGALTIYFAFHLAQPKSQTPSLGISHGIFWDHAVFQYPSAKLLAYRNTFLEAMANCQHLVSVDTNTINWVRANDVRQSDKMTYIPNFVDTDVFFPRKDSADRQKLVVLYPRRLYGPRGFWLVAEIVPSICKRHPNVEFHFVGKGDAAELEYVDRLAREHPGRVRHYYCEPEEMHEVYREADITLIPTVASEGTSLSCIEALASGNAVIATNVGGLPDLIIDSHNGLLVSPKGEQIGEALERLITNRSLRLRLQSKAREVAEHFSIKVWRKRWLAYLSQLLPPRAAAETEPSPQYYLVHPQTPGISYERMKQRPQHLFRAFAELGHHAFFVNERRANDAAPPISKELAGGKLHVLSSHDEIHLTQPVIYAYYAYLYPELSRWVKKTVIYDVLDDPLIHEDSDRASGRTPEDNYMHFHKKLLAEADIVVASSQKLVDSLRRERPDVLLAPNAVHADDFAAGNFIRPKDIAPDTTIIVGYFGAISKWFDFDVMERAARRYPGYQFVLIGPTDVPDRLESLLARNRNIVHLGEKPYDQLPHYLHFFDAAIIPFVRNEITAAVSPVKLFEYLAGGKPIVSADLPECSKVPNVFIARDADDFVAKIDEAIQRGTDRFFVEELRKTATANSWKARAMTILDALNKLDAARKGKSA